MSFIAAMDHSGGSTGGVLDRYGQEYTEENKMEKVHAMRLRMVNSPDFVKENIWASILYVDTVERGMVTVLQEKGIEAFLKVDSGCEEDGSLKDFDLQLMIDTALFNKCSGTKMRSIVKSIDTMDKILDQQFDLAQRIYDAGLNHKKPISVQISEEYKKNDKAAKKANKAAEKAKKDAAKKTKKFATKSKHKVKTTKGKSSGDN